MTTRKIKTGLTFDMSIWYLHLVKSLLADGYLWVSVKSFALLNKGVGFLRENLTEENLNLLKFLNYEDKNRKV